MSLLCKTNVFQISAVLFLYCYPQTGFPFWWVSSQKTQPSQKIRRRKNLLLAASKEGRWDLSPSSVSLNSKTGEVLS